MIFRRRFVPLLTMFFCCSVQAAVKLVVSPRAPHGDEPVAASVVEPPYLLTDYAFDLRYDTFFTLDFVSAPAHPHVAAHLLVPCDEANALMVVDAERTCMLTDRGRKILSQRYADFNKGRDVTTFVQETVRQLLLLALSGQRGFDFTAPTDVLSIQLVQAVAQKRIVLSRSRYIVLAEAIWQRCCGSNVKITLPLTEDQQGIIMVAYAFFSSLARQMNEALSSLSS